MNNFGTGLVSVSFRNLPPDQIIALARQAELQSIEWGGDIHVPPENLENARIIGEMTRAAGLFVACYGSYYRLTDAEEGMAERTVAAAKALGAPLIRVWAGKKSSIEASRDDREMVCRNMQHICDLAAQENIRVAFEYHGGTLTDDALSAIQLLQAVNRPNARTLWQPPVGMSVEDCLKSIKIVENCIENIHVFSWDDHGARLPLKDRAGKWRAILDALPGEHNLMLEFVAQDDPMQLIRDAATLRSWLRGEWS